MANLYREEGYVILKNFFNPSEVHELKRHVTELEKTDPDSERPLIYFEKSREKVIPLRIEYFFESSPIYKDLFSSERTLDVIEKITNKRLVLFKDKVIYKHPGSSGFKPHQDANLGWADLVKSDFINFFVGIDECNEFNGPLEIVPESHKRGRIGAKWHLISDEMSASLAFRPILTSPGDVIIFNAWLVHRSSPNTSDSSRTVIYLSYSEREQGDQREKYYKFLPNIRRKFVLNKIKNKFSNEF